MGKVAPVSAKYIINAIIKAEGVVDKPDVIGAIFGQTEGLLGSDLELRELQKSGRIGRIEVELDTKEGKTSGEILIPSSMDKSDTAIIAASLETIQRIGPCNAKIDVRSIEDVRVSKREYLVERAKEILKNMIDKELPDSAELSQNVKQGVRVLGIQEYGPDRLPAGPDVEKSDEIIVCEGRADIINLLKSGFANVIALNGTAIPESIIPLCDRKEITLFIDGDRGGKLILKALSQMTDVDFVATAPAGKEVEELTKKEIHQALRARKPVAKEKRTYKKKTYERKPTYERKSTYERKPVRRRRFDPEKAKLFKSMLTELTGTSGAFILAKDLSILGKVPLKELPQTLKSLRKVYAVVIDGETNEDIIYSAERTGVRYLVARESKGQSRRVNIILESDL